MSFSLIQIIILLGICQGIYFSLILFFWKTIASRANMYLGFLLLSISGSLMQYWMCDVGLISNNELHFIFLPWHTVVAPFFLLYIFELQIFKTRKIRGRILFIPCLVVCAIQVLIKSDMLASGISTYATPSLVADFYRIEEYFVLFFSLSLIIYVFYALQDERLRTGLKGFGVNREIVQWIRSLSTVAILLCTAWFSSLFFFDQLVEGFSSYYFLWIVLVAIICALGTIGIYYSFKHRDQPSKKIEITDLPGHESNGHKHLYDQKSPIKISPIEAVSSLNQMLSTISLGEQILPLMVEWLENQMEVVVKTCPKSDSDCTKKNITISGNAKVLSAPLLINNVKITLVLTSTKSGYFNETHLYLIKLMGDVVRRQAKRLSSQSPSAEQIEHPILIKLRGLLDQHIYCNPSCDLGSLASQIDISPGYLSKLINEVAGMGFNDFINTHRIAYVKDLMIHPEYMQYTLTGLGLEAGFNSKSTFYAAFRKLEKMSPGQYQRKVRGRVGELAF